MPSFSPLLSIGKSSPSRRLFVQVALAAGLPTANAQQTSSAGYEISNWSGPISGFSLVDLTGKTWRDADLKGQAVLLNFWASWCEPCRAELPSLQQLAAQRGPGQLRVLAINFKESAARAVQFASANGLALPVLLDVDGLAAKRWGVKIFPTTLAIDNRGLPRLRIQGEFDWTGKAAEKLIAGLVR